MRWDQTLHSRRVPCDWGMLLACQSTDHPHCSTVRQCQWQLLGCNKTIPGRCDVTVWLTLTSYTLANWQSTVDSRQYMQQLVSTSHSRHQRNKPFAVHSLQYDIKCFYEQMSEAWLMPVYLGITLHSTLLYRCLKHDSCPSTLVSHSTLRSCIHT